MPNRRTVVLPVIPRPRDPGDLLIRAFANRSTFGTLHILPDQDLHIASFVNLSLFDTLTLRIAGDDITLPALVNLSELGNITVQEAPADESLLITALINTSTFGALTLVEAPPDVSLFLTALTNVSVLHDISVAFESDVSEDEGEGIGTAMIGETII